MTATEQVERAVAGRARSATPGHLTTAIGVLAMIVAGVVAGSYVPFWFDPDEGCRSMGRCPGPAMDAAVSVLWVVEGAGFAVVLAGLAVVAHRLRATPLASPSPLLPAWAVVAVGALAATVVNAALGWFVVIAVFVSGQAAVAAVCLLWLVQAMAVAACERRARPIGSTGRSALTPWLTGLIVSAVAVGAVVWWTTGRPGDLNAVPAVAGVAVALGLLVRRSAAAGAVRASAALTLLVAFGAVLAGTGGTHLAGTGPGPSNPQASLLPPPVPVPQRREPVVAAPVATTAAGTVDAAVACAGVDLDWRATEPDAAMGARAVAIVATSHARRPCYLAGAVTITISQGGHDLRLTTEPDTDATSTPNRRVGLAPAGSASFHLLWNGYGAAADHHTPQELRVTLAGESRSSTVPLGAPTPFDLIDGGTVRVGPWEPGPP
ncbi:DUF4232 domain-containing protein [Pseudonocardia sp. CA-107938]|uniref:DUF4232 domain-containing protein n=1 Tax=Pseudonocardia sp. CA-107938 TaxID=3240021 RepID=UPI003D8EF284